MTAADALTEEEFVERTFAEFDRRIAARRDA